MNKRSLIIATAFLTVISTLAVPARRDVRVVRQPDGTEIHLYMMGDERAHTLVTTDGLAVERDSQGYFRYRMDNCLSEITVSDPSKRKGVEREFVANNLQALDGASLLNKRAALVSALAPEGPNKIGRPEIPTTDSPRIPVILLQYTDKKFRDGDNAIETFRSFFTEGEKCALRYFTDQSAGQYTPQFELYGPYTLSHERAYYGGNNWNGTDKGLGIMAAEGIELVAPDTDFSLYDNDEDKECDVVIFIFAGDGESSSMDPDAANAIWPCQWTLSASEYRQPLFFNGVKVNRFAAFNELYGLDRSQIDGIGCFCHEFSHCLGLPDFYPTEYQPYFGMSYWSVMDYGCYNDNGYTPLGYSAYEKEFNGWLTIPEGTPDTHYTLEPLNNPEVYNDIAVRLTNDKAPNEYYILENRAKHGWDKFLPTSGLLIYHVTYDQKAWNDNKVNDYAMQRMTPVPADGELKLDYIGNRTQANYQNLLGDLWPYGDANELTDTSSPTAAVVNNGSRLGKPVTEITRNDDGTISFWVMKAPRPALETPILIEPTTIEPTEFLAQWNEVESEVELNYTLEIRPHQEYVYSELFTSDYEDIDTNWTLKGFTKVDAEPQALRLGSKSQHGIVTSPLYELEGTQATVILRANQYEDDTDALLKVSLLDSSDNTIVSEDITLGMEPADFCIKFDGIEVEAKSVKVRLETITRGLRSHIYYVSLYQGDASCLGLITDILPPTSEAKDTIIDDVRVISGINATEYKVSGLEPNAQYDVRLRAVPLSTDDFSASPWSETIVVTMADEAGITGITIDNIAQIEYYDLSGRRITYPSTSGIYIMRQGSKVTKLKIQP